MSPDFQIISSRLVLKLIEPDQTQTLCHAIQQSPSLHQWVDWCRADFSAKEAERFLLATRLNWVKGEAYGFGVFRRSDDQLLGMVAINEMYHTFNMVSLGYWIADAHQGNGYGSEALQALIHFCFEKLKVTRVEIVCDPANLPSQKLALACGAQYEVTAQNRYVFNNQPRDGMVFSVLP